MATSVADEINAAAGHKPKKNEDGLVHVEWLPPTVVGPHRVTQVGTVTAATELRRRCFEGAAGRPPRSRRLRDQRPARFRRTRAEALAGATLDSVRSPSPQLRISARTAPSRRLQLCRARDRADQAVACARRLTAGRSELAAVVRRRRRLESGEREARAPP